MFLNMTQEPSARLNADSGTDTKNNFASHNCLPDTPPNSGGSFEGKFLEEVPRLQKAECTPPPSLPQSISPPESQTPTSS
jgi:hypothetical protein